MLPVETPGCRELLQHGKIRSRRYHWRAGQSVSALSNAVGLLFDASPRPSTRSIPRLTPATKTPMTTSSAKTVVLNLSQMKLRNTAIKSMGDVLAVLGDLEKRGGVSLNREVDVVPRKLASEPPKNIAEQFQYVDGAVAELIRRLASKGRIEFNPFEMVEDIEGPQVHADKLECTKGHSSTDSETWRARPESRSDSWCARMTRSSGRPYSASFVLQGRFLSEALPARSEVAAQGGRRPAVHPDLKVGR